MRALVTGATGFVGRRLLGRLQQPVVLSRDAGRARRLLAAEGHQVEAHRWDPQSEPPPIEALDGVEVVFHLAGEPVAEGRWTAAKKKRLRESRVAGTRNLVQSLSRLAHKPRLLISASAVGFYGSRGDELLDESAAPGNDFLAEICAAWEAEALLARQHGIRVVCPRIGIVLGQGGGALAKMLVPFRYGLGSPLGSGRPWMPWIHIDDLVNAMLFAVEHQQLAGPLNGAAPHPVTNRQFTKTLGKVLARPTILPPVPGFMLRLMLGEFGTVLLSSQRAIPKAAQDAGFEFQFPSLEAALRDILSSNRSS